MQIFLIRQKILNHCPDLCLIQIKEFLNDRTIEISGQA